ncbi:MAG: hypothetical protein WCK15_19970 [Pirellula sp.]
MSALSPFPTISQFPSKEIEQLLRQSLENVANDTEFLRPDRPEWEPLLDSQRVVEVVTRLDKLLDMKIPPDKVVQKGGYMSVDEAIRGITSKTYELWTIRKTTRKLA